MAKAKGTSLQLKMVTQRTHQKKLGMNALPRSESAGTFAKLSTTTWMKACQKLQHVPGCPSSKKKEAEQLLKDGQANVQKLKTLLVKRTSSMTMEKAKGLMLACTTKAKEIKEERKELDQVASKAMSKATTKK